jgi:hypothetical protein
MKEWKQFTKVRGIMKQVNHPLMIEKINNVWAGFQALNIKPKYLNESISAQNYLRKVLPEIKNQAESCLYYPYMREKNNHRYSDVVNANSVQMLEIISMLEEY